MIGVHMLSCGEVKGHRYTAGHVLCRERTARVHEPEVVFVHGTNIIECRDPVSMEQQVFCEVPKI